jgi:hypothetical protein
MKFHAELQLDGKTATGVTVPAEVLDALGAGRRPSVVVTINGHSFRTTIGSMGGVAKIPVSSAVRTRAGAAAGDTLDVEVILDTAPREVSVPARHPRRRAMTRQSRWRALNQQKSRWSTCVSVRPLASRTYPTRTPCRGLPQGPQIGIMALANADSGMG